MTVEDFERLFDYGYWANRKLFPVLSQLTEEQFTQSVGGSYGSVRNTLVHMLSAEWGWLERCGGPARGPALQGDDFPTVHAVVEAWARVEGWMRAFLAGLDEERLQQQMEFKSTSGETRSMVLGELLQHSANHAVHHRGQVALLLRMLGHTPGNFDFLIYDAERHGVVAW